jgi:hypothetical protein
MKTLISTMKRLGGLALGLVLLTALGMSSAEAGSPDNVSQLFGSRVQANDRFAVPFATADFDGDGTADAVYLVTILPQSTDHKLASDVAVIGKLFGRAPLGPRGEALALAILQDGGKRKFLLTGYQGDGVTSYFESPIWSETPIPLAIAKRGSKSFEEFHRQEKRIAHDILVVGTEAGIDTALYWTGQSYAWFQPLEEP